MKKLWIQKDSKEWEHNYKKKKIKLKIGMIKILMIVVNISNIPKKKCKYYRHKMGMYVVVKKRQY